MLVLGVEPRSGCLGSPSPSLQVLVVPGEAVVQNHLTPLLLIAITWLEVNPVSLATQNKTGQGSARHFTIPSPPLGDSDNVGL